VNWNWKWVGFLWLCCLIAQILKMIVSAGQSAKSAHTPYESIRDYFIFHWPKILWRVSISSFFFGWWVADPPLVEKIMYSIGDKVSGSESAIAKTIRSFSIPLNPATAGMYGMVADIGADWLWLTLSWVNKKFRMNGKEEEVIKKDEKE